MHSFRQENQAQEWRAGDVLPAGLDASPAVTPEVEDARRRFVLSLRAMTARKEKQERDAAAIQQWMKTLEADVAAHKKWRRRKFRRRALVWCVLIVIFLASQGLFGMRGIENYWWVLFFLASGGAAAEAVDPRRPREMATLLSRARDPRAVSVLAITARDGDPDTKRLAEEGLRSILAQLQASDAEYVTDQGMNALLALLGRSPDPRLQLAILRALEQVGDERAISVVNMLAETDADPRVAEAARNCLRFLQARAEQARQRHVLLRPAANVEPDRNLLRPAGPTETPAENLLRPTES